MRQELQLVLAGAVTALVIKLMTRLLVQWYSGRDNAKESDAFHKQSEDDSGASNQTRWLRERIFLSLIYLVMFAVWLRITKRHYLFYKGWSVRIALIVLCLMTIAFISLTIAVFVHDIGWLLLGFGIVFFFIGVRENYQDFLRKKRITQRADMIVPELIIPARKADWELYLDELAEEEQNNRNWV